MDASCHQSSLPRGFTVFQPMLGAQLQFSPALGTQQLDDLVHAYIPGPALISVKRASIAVDFLQSVHQTGQMFKFYPVAPSLIPSATPMTPSPSLGSSSSSSFNASPVMSNWDWSATTSVSSTSPPRHHSPSQSRTTTPPSRQRTKDYSDLPGMKILTKDGRDVTNSASRGSKTKEQRYHAHLMRVIKACDSCRRKKIRCDPSHKRRGTNAQDQVQTPPVATGPRPRKKPRQAQRPLRDAPASPKEQCPASVESAAPTLGNDVPLPTSTFDLDFDFSLPGFDSQNEPQLVSPEDWEQFIEYPPSASINHDDDLDVFLGTDGFSSYHLPPFSPSSFEPLPHRHPLDPSAPPGSNTSKTVTPASMLLYDMLGGSFGGDMNYEDFNLYSPRSSFSEDNLMLSISASRDSLYTTTQKSSPSCCPKPRLDGLQDVLSDTRQMQTSISSDPQTRLMNAGPSQTILAPAHNSQRHVDGQPSSTTDRARGICATPGGQASCCPTSAIEAGFMTERNMASLNASSLGATARPASGLGDAMGSHVATDSNLLDSTATIRPRCVPTTNDIKGDSSMKPASPIYNALEPTGIGLAPQNGLRQPATTSGNASASSGGAASSWAHSALRDRSSGHLAPLASNSLRQPSCTLSTVMSAAVKQQPCGEGTSSLGTPGSSGASAFAIGLQPGGPAAGGHIASDAVMRRPANDVDQQSLAACDSPYGIPRPSLGSFVAVAMAVAGFALLLSTDTFCAFYVLSVILTFKVSACRAHTTPGLVLGEHMVPTNCRPGSSGRPGGFGAAEIVARRPRPRDVPRSPCRAKLDKCWLVPNLMRCLC